MADVLGATASIIALVEVCGKIIRCIREIRNGPSERTRLLTEILSTKGILDALKSTIESNDEETGDQVKTIPSLNQQGGPLDLLQITLVSLQNDLAFTTEPKTFRARGKSLVWPFTKLEVEERLRALDRYKMLLTLALDNDHITLSREIRQDTVAIREGVANIKADVTAMRTGLQQKEEEHQRTVILKWLTEVDYAAQQHDFHSRRQEGTGHWLVESNEFTTWIEEKQQTLFCPGIPGAGKTILVSSVVDHLDALRDSQDIGLAYIYCNFRQQSNQGLSALLSSLLKQLARQHESLQDSIRSLHEKHSKRRTKPSIDEISSTLLAVVASYPRVFIVIDALDECQNTDGSRNNLLTKLFAIQNHTGMNILVTSRPTPEIAERFQCGVTMEIRASPSDVERYTESRIPHLPSFVSRNPSLQEEIKSAIVQAVDGM